MKKVILALTLFLGTSVVMTSMNSCGVSQNAVNNPLGTIKTINEVENVAATARQIASVLGATLGLKSNQESSLNNIFSNYIGNTNGIASLAKTNIASYAEKLTSLNTGVLGKLKDLLTVEQYAKLLGIGGKNTSESSLLGRLAGGNTLSKNSANVLSGLLLNGI